MPDKYQALWVSHSSIGDYLACPRAYYLNNVYKDPATGHKITLMSPPLALGQAVHEVVESLSVIPTDQRFKVPLHERFEQVWEKVSGKKGGFSSEEQERRYKDRGRKMLSYVEENPGPVGRLAVKIKMDLPHYWLSEEKEIILCGKVDWLEYLPDEDAVHIIDFKTGRYEESEDSLQLPIYYLLASNTQKRNVAKASYWYLMKESGAEAVELPEEEAAYERVMEVAKKIKLARKLDKLECQYGGCRVCEPLERVVAGEATLVDVNDFNQDVYVLEKAAEMPESEIL